MSNNSILLTREVFIGDSNEACKRLLKRKYSSSSYIEPLGICNLIAVDLLIASDY